jgi:predicted ribosomally synthesized peptide with nif11-like leader
MSADQYGEFMKKVESDRSLRQKLREVKVAAVIGLAKECGFDVQPDDLKKDRQSA